MVSCILSYFNEATPPWYCKIEFGVCFNILKYIKAHSKPKTEWNKWKYRKTEIPDPGISWFTMEYHAPQWNLSEIATWGNNIPTLDGHTSMTTCPWPHEHVPIYWRRLQRVFQATWGTCKHFLPLGFPHMGCMALVRMFAAACVVHSGMLYNTILYIVTDFTHFLVWSVL